MVAKMLERPALVLNRNWQPVADHRFAAVPELPKLLDQVRFPGTDRSLVGRATSKTTNVLGVCRIARNLAKVEDQVQFLARTLKQLTLEPDGTAAACKAASSGFDSRRRL